jgi:hypothetical protein
VFDPYAIGGGPGGRSDTQDGRGRKGQTGTFYVESLVTGAQPQVSVSGVCGAALVEITGGTPLGRFEVWEGTGLGSDPVPLGTCAGVVSGLAAPTLAATRTLDEAGTFVFSGGGGRCAVDVQVVDLWSCATSAVVRLP